MEGEGDEMALGGDCGASVLEEELVTKVDAVEVTDCERGFVVGFDRGLGRGLGLGQIG